MLQNRVDPYGNIISTSARGSCLGNRGQLHGKGKTILRPFKHKAWIICLLQFKGRHREIMAPNRWTELFFLDEATAFAAGHRPCFECRRDDANRFNAAWLKGNPEFGLGIKTPVGKIDEIIHSERIDVKGDKIIFKANIDELPNGTFIKHQDKPFIINDARIYKWSASGYGEAQPLPQAKMATVLTPKSIVNAFKAGYQPQLALVNS